MSTGTLKQKPAQVKDVYFLSPDELVLNRKWNGRWQAISDTNTFDENAPLGETQQVSIRELADNIKELGQLEEVLIREDAPDKHGLIYHVVAGQSRTRAFALLAKEETDPKKEWKIRCRLLPKGTVKDDKEAFLYNEAENVQRNNLTLLDKAFCMQRERDDLGYAAADIAKRWHCTVPAVAQALSLVDPAKMPVEVQQAVYDKALAATDAIDAMKHLTLEAKIEIAALAQEAKAKGTPLRSSHIKELARARTQATPPAAPAAPAAGAPGDATTAPAANGATTPAPTRRGRGRPSSAQDRVPRGVPDIRKALQGREDSLSVSIIRYFAGHKDMDDDALRAVLDAHAFPDGKAPPIQPRTEGAEQPAEGATA